MFGKLVLHSKKLGAIGIVKIGDTLGEEALLGKSGKGSGSGIINKGSLRKESAYSDGESYVIEISK